MANRGMPENISRLPINFPNSYFIFVLELENVRTFTEEILLQDTEIVKNPQQSLQLVDELIKRRLNPDENEFKIKALASKSKFPQVILLLALFLVIYLNIIINSSH